jgi:hypothetical protein
MRPEWKLVVLPLLILFACGRDYTPATPPVTGRPASTLGEIWDLEMDLPGLQVQGSIERGARLELTVKLSSSEETQLVGRALSGRLYWDNTSAAIEILGDASVTVFRSETLWATGTIGPLRVDTTVFEVILDAVREPAGFQLSGRSWESQSGTFGDGLGWRRQRFLVTTTDFFGGGRVGVVSMVRRGSIEVEGDLVVVGADPIARATIGGAYVVNRLGDDSLMRLDTDENFALTWERSTGRFSNPHDMVVVSDRKGYLTRYESPFNDLWIFDPRNGDTLGSVPLGSFAENRDGLPRADKIVSVEGNVFVSLQDIDASFSRYSDGKLVVVDPVDDTALEAIPLFGKNPGAIEPIIGSDGSTRLFVALAGIFPGVQSQELSGGVAVVDPVGRLFERWALDDDSVGGNIAGLAMVGSRLGYVVVSDTQFRNRVVAFDPQSAQPLRTILETNAFIPEIAVGGGGLLAIPDRSFGSSGLCLYGIPDPEDPLAVEQSFGCAPLSLPPFSVEALD